VVAIGPGVRYVRPDDKVVLHWRKGQGIEAQPAHYTWDGRRVNAGWVTTFNDWAVISENRLTVIPADSDLAVAALFGCAVTTGFGVIVNNAQVRIGESVVVFGAGGVGLNIVQAASMSSAYPVIAVDLFDNKLALAQTLGATHVINARHEDARSRISDILGAGGLDVFIDNTGMPDIIELGYGMVHAQGRVILVGVPKKGADVKIHSLPLHFGKILTGSYGGETIPQTDIPRYQTLFRNGRLQLRQLITEYYSLGDINSAIRAMRDGTIAGRCLIRM
jgi:S-(hydroxymethyl)glutathione dehydrogenase/alcohol dehydrogenase